MPPRPYNPERDREAIHRIWREVHWIKNEIQADALDHFLEDARAFVADLDGEAECMAATTPATLRYLDEDLRLSAVAAVTTSRIARKQGLGGRVTAAAIAADAADGALVSALGIFEQGYYDRLGYGTCGYEHWVRFDPALLTLKRKTRVPRRLTPDDWEMIHRAMLNRQQGHGAVNLLNASNFRAEMGWTGENAFGLGYTDGPDGPLTHFFWGDAKDENGPYSLIIFAFQNGEQFLDLMALVKALSDQVHLVEMREPRGIQLQDLLRHPFRQQHVTKDAEFANRITAKAYCQMRICDLPGCLAQTHLPGEPVRFNLVLHDPIEAYLDAGAPWRGISGDYVVTLGPASHAEAGTAADLPTLTASVGAFTRLWLGIRPATGLAVTDDLAGPASLLQSLDTLLRLPEAKPDWEF